MNNTVPRREGMAQYGKKKLQRIIGEILTVAQDNLRKHGYLRPVGLIYTTAGMTHIFEFKFKGVEQKRQSQQAFKKLVADVQALAVIVVTESWIKMPPDVPVDVTRSVADMPGRQEAIVIEGASPKARVVCVQVFRKGESGISFDEPENLGDRFTWTSEWTNGLWSHEKGGDPIGPIQ
jgi:hypothetical protein